jgi:hypothetical protein
MLLGGGKGRVAGSGTVAGKVKTVMGVQKGGQDLHSDMPLNMVQLEFFLVQV